MLGLYPEKSKRSPLLQSVQKIELKVIAESAEVTNQSKVDLVTTLPLLSQLLHTSQIRLYSSYYAMFNSGFPGLQYRVAEASKNYVVLCPQQINFRKLKSPLFFMRCPRLDLGALWLLLWHRNQQKRLRLLIPEVLSLLPWQCNYNFGLGTRNESRCVELGPCKEVTNINFGYHKSIDDDHESVCRKKCLLGGVKFVSLFYRWLEKWSIEK